MPLANNIDHDESSLVQDAWDRDEEDGGDLENEAGHGEPGPLLQVHHDRRRAPFRGLTVSTSVFQQSITPPPTALVPTISVTDSSLAERVDTAFATAHIPSQPDVESMKTLLKALEELGRERRLDEHLKRSADLYNQIQEPCQIEVLDYSSEQTSSSTVMSNAQLVSWLNDVETSKRPEWADVRWINVAGISWDVVSALASRYDMHKLAIKDLLQQRAQARSKAEYYPEHLYLRVLTHLLEHSTADVEEVTSEKKGGSAAEPLRAGLAVMQNILRAASSSDVAVNDVPSGPGCLHPGRAHADPLHAAEAGIAPHRTAKHYITYGQLKDAHRVDVKLALLDVFLYRDGSRGTVITFHPGPELCFTRPLVERVREEDSALRREPDVSTLLHGLLDLVVDRTLEVTDEYRRIIGRLEGLVLKAPEMTNVRALHVLSGDLISHKRSMGPIKTLVYGLRRYDVDRHRVAMGLPPSAFAGKGIPSPVPSDATFSPYITPQTNVYLADVHDHMEYALENMNMYAATTENLINYTFNMASYETNNVMRSLTLVTVIFFPLTLLTGYFGMNFEAMWSVNKHTDLLFWEIALPVLSVCIPVFLWKDIARIARYTKQRWHARRIMQHRVMADDLRKMA